MATVSLQPGGAKPQVLRFRNNINALTKDQLIRLRATYTASYALNDERGYAHHAGLHGLPLPVECSHDSTLWLPWHRAYLYFFEMSLRDINHRVVQPWWSWASGKLPVAYTQELRKKNPLLSAPIPPNAQLDGGPSKTFRTGPNGLPTQADINDALSRSDFLDFSEALRQLHNSVHGSIGGSMGGVSNAAFDPIFWAHHCFVDRIWRIWQQRHPAAVFAQSFLNQPLAPFPMTVQQTMSVTALGYDYARTVLAIPGTSG